MLQFDESHFPLSNSDQKKLQEGGVVLVVKEGASLLLLKEEEGDRVFVCENRCPHKDLPLDGGSWEGATCRLTCPFHGAVFDLNRKGAWVQGQISPPLVWKGKLSFKKLLSFAQGVN